MRNTERPVESVDRALRLLGRLQTGEHLSVTAAAEELEVAPSTAHRLLNALRYRGFAEQDDARRYVAGPALHHGGAMHFSSAAIQRAARPCLTALNERTAETTHLMVLQGNRVHFIDGVESSNPLRVAIRVGARMPAHCSAGGKALLAALSDERVRQLHRAGLPSWPTSRMAGVDELLGELDGVRRTGYGLNVEETEPGVCGIGVCITDPDSGGIAALTLAIPSVRFDRRDLGRFTTPLAQAATATNQRLLLRPH